MLSAYQAVFPECFWTTAHILHILRIFLGSNPNLFSWTQCWNTHPSWRNTHKYLLQHLRVFLTLFQLNWVAKWEQDWNYFLEFSEIGQFPTAHPTISDVLWCAGNPCCKVFVMLLLQSLKPHLPPVLVVSNGTVYICINHLSLDRGEKHNQETFSPKTVRAGTEPNV